MQKYTLNRIIIVKGCLLILLVLSMTVHAQQAAPDLKKELDRFTISYKQFFDLLTIEKKIDLHYFEELFLDDASVRIAKDFFWGDTGYFETAVEYYYELTNLFFTGSLFLTELSTELSTARETYYCSKENYCYIWMYKSFSYQFMKQPKKVAGWIRLTVVWSTPASRFRIKIAEKVNGPPDDLDHDGIADDCDACKYSTGRKNIGLSGCEPGS